VSPAETDLGFPPCMKPPLGWVCTRDPNHDGPCAAIPVGNDIAAVQIERFKECLEASHRAFAKICRDTAAVRHPTPASKAESDPALCARLHREFPCQSWWRRLWCALRGHGGIHPFWPGSIRAICKRCGSLVVLS
jgi:hypothetical protein